ncbi:glycosyltransferase family 2 protein [Phosphitispora sp. TUW77]|uniref:glycosyltransferase family 2 protein n=1 Tax=Phosphitispora sp. TUW77 TaxID=3152361 RepID=UPI003AB63E10
MNLRKGSRNGNITGIKQGDDMDLSIILVNYNTRGLLRDCLKSVYDNKPGLEYEVFVVDNGSVDGSLKMLAKEYPQVRVIANGDNLGFAGANNKAIKQCLGQYILLLNSDTLIIDRDSFDNMVNYIATRPDIGILGCMLLNKDYSLQLSYGKFPTLGTEFSQKFINFMFSRGGGPYYAKIAAEYREEHPVDWVTGACLLVRLEAVQQAGLLDERFFMYFEDVDWCRRINNCGWRIVYFPGARVIHLLGGSAPKQSNISVIYKESQLRYYHKHRNKVEVNLLRAIQVVKHLALLVKLKFYGLITCKDVSDESKKLIGVIRIFWSKSMP